MGMKSGVSWARRHITGPGKSSHNGRGAYEMSHSKTPEELFAAARTAGELALKNGDATEAKTDKQGNFVITLNDMFGDCYRTIVVYGPTNKYWFGNIHVVW